MRMSSTANGDGTAVETKFIKKLSEIQHLSCGQRNKFTGSLYARASATERAQHVPSESLLLIILAMLVLAHQGGSLMPRVPDPDSPGVPPYKA